MPSPRSAGRTAPFAAVAFLSYVLSVALGQPLHYVPFALSALLTAGALGLPMCLPRTRLPRGLRSVLPVVCLVAIGLLRVSAGGSVSGYGPLFILPILWLALYGNNLELAVGFASLLATLVGSDAVAGASELATAELRKTLLFLAVAMVTGISVKRLVNEIRRQTRQREAQAVTLRDAERRTREARDLFAGILSAATEYAIIATNPEGIITVFNEGAERMLGYRAAGLVGVRSLEALHLGSEVDERASELGIEPGLEVFVEAARYGIAETRDWTWVRRDGRHVPVSETVTAMYGPEGELTGFIVIAADTTLRRMEQARTRAIIASQAEIASAGHEAGIVMERIADRALRLTGASGATVEIAEDDAMVYALATGTLAGLAGTRVPRAGSLSGLCLAEERVQSCEDTGLDPRVDHSALGHLGARSLVVVPLRHQGAMLAVLKVVSARHHAFTDTHIETLELLANLMGAALAHASDYARVAEANARLVELDRMKDAFVATVSHELRTPMSSIIAYTEMLSDGDAGELTGPQRHMVEAVARNSGRLRSLIEDLLTVSQIEAGVFKLRREDTDVRQLLEGVAAALAPAAQEASIKLQVDIPDDAGAVLADPRALDRALMNVLANAIKFSLPGGEVELTGRRCSAVVEIAVTDRGIGIGPEDQSRVFERFFRASSGEERAIPGSGLGLSIVKEIVESHGGQVRLESILGEGTTVTVRLPPGVQAVDDRPVATAPRNTHDERNQAREDRTCRR
jgi:PAS domain S-box-containing protein